MAAGNLLPAQIVERKAASIQQAWSRRGHVPALAEVVSAAALAKHGLLTSVRNLSLRNLDTAAVAELAVLASRVTDRVELDGVGGDLGPVLAGLRCDLLALASMELSSADTRQLEAAMVAGVRMVRLGEDLSLDMETLAQYDGRGQCAYITMAGSRAGYREHFLAWADRMGWRKSSYGASLTIFRVSGLRNNIGFYIGHCCEFLLDVLTLQPLAWASAYLD